jgi:hypothetical protein
MRTSNPSSYDKIFEIYNSATTYNGGVGIMTASVVGSHRGLLLVNTSTTASNSTFTITNIDGTTAPITIAPGATLLPVQIWKLTVASAQGGIRIYGLV